MVHLERDVSATQDNVSNELWKDLWSYEVVDAGHVEVGVLKVDGCKNRASDIVFKLVKLIASEDAPLWFLSESP